MDKEKYRAYKHEYYLKHKERIKARVKKRQDADPEKYKTYQKENYQEHREARVAQSRKWREHNREYHRSQSRKYAQEHKSEISHKLKEKRRKLKQSVLDAYGGKCACCNETTYEFLTLDHINGDGAAHRRSLGLKQQGETSKLYQTLFDTGFPSGFRILCFNCNSSLGFYGYCPHHPESLAGVPTRRRVQTEATS